MFEFSGILQNIFCYLFKLWIFCHYTARPFRLTKTNRIICVGTKNFKVFRHTRFCFRTLWRETLKFTLNVASFSVASIILSTHVTLKGWFNLLANHASRRGLHAMIAMKRLSILVNLGTKLRQLWNIRYFRRCLTLSHVMTRKTDTWSCSQDWEMCKLKSV